MREKKGLNLIPPHIAPSTHFTPRNGGIGGEPDLIGGTPGRGPESTLTPDRVQACV